ncbi:MAG: S9 family peptidase [Bacteroidales bacterium]|nr:S9 family peptidase [Bacteroidales bacterium]
MKKIKILALPALAACLFILSWGCDNLNKPMKAKLIPLEDFFRNPEQTAYQISPDGRHYSFLSPYESRLNIFIRQIGKEESTRLTSETDRDIAGYFWANDAQILYLKDQGGDENYRLYGVNIDGTNPVCYTEFEGVRTQIIDDLPDIPGEVIISMNKRNPQVFDPYRLDLNTGEMTMLAENPGNIQAWIFDHDGKLRVAIAITDGVNTSLLYRETEADEWKNVLTTSFKDEVAPFFFTFDNRNIYGTSNLGRDKSAVVEFDIANGQEIRILYEHPEFDISSISYSRKRKVLAAASYTSYKRERYFFDDTTKLLFEKLESRLEGYEIGISAFNKNEDMFIVRTYSDRSLGAYYLYNLNTDELNKIVDVSPWLDENEMAVMNPIQYTSRDGKTIHGYLTLPKGYTLDDAKNLPVVVNPHGGPWYRDSWGFNPEIQFLANRGYAVMQMNFRGSTGYGKAFWESSFKKWGREMQDDITDGTKWLIDQGIADPERIAIYGGSYGGYATLMGLVKEPDLYAAGVDYVGVSNMFTFMKTIPPYWEPLLDMFYEMVGNPQNDSLMLREVSPVFNADKIQAPLFIAQGANDPRVNKDESDQMVEALKARGIEVQYMVKDNEGHGFHNEENRFDFYRAMEQFLAQHMGQEETAAK